ncbi:MAG: CHAT domain-containing protein [Candidatus Competibacteraceae bacterium]
MQQRSIRWLRIVLVLMPTLAAAFTSDANLAEQRLQQGTAAFQRGDFAQAAVAWQQVSDYYAQANQPERQVDALLQLADAYTALGQSRQALQVLLTAEPLAERSGDRARIAATAVGLGQAYRLTGDPTKARQELETGIRLARQIGNDNIAAAGLNNLATLSSEQRQSRAALDSYRQSLELARRGGADSLAAKAATNAAQTAVQLSDTTLAATLLDTAWQQTQTLEDSHDKAYQWLALGKVYAQMPTDQTRWRPPAYRAFQQANSIAAKLNDQRTLAYAWGELGHLYQTEQRYPDALAATRRAVFAAQAAQAPEILYRWQWQLGRLLKAQGDMEGALSAYRQAVSNLQSIRPELTLSYASRSESFREAVGDVFFELADLLLQRSSRLSTTEQQPYLREARDTVEILKTNELKDYFQDDCVVALQSRITPLDRLASRTAALYPVLLPDRTELLLSLPEGIQRFTVPVDRDTLTRTVRDFRRYLEKRTTREYLPYARRLYGWLIAPVEPTLREKRVETLIIVPDGPLRTIPIAALHDGQQFLIDRYALATTPGLSLTDLRPLQRQDTRLLLNGLTQATQGFPALTHVAEELQTIHATYGGKVLADENFLIPNLQRELTDTPYSIVHIASHGQFESDVDKTFLLTFDGKLTMDRLERLMGLSQYRDRPVELLTLSACQTAAGDDRAALGLAGIAVKAGARSAIATLWTVDDEATALLLAEFYRQLQQPGTSKAGALRRAQLFLLGEPRYRHPGYWSPFLLIGNWL